MIPEPPMDAIDRALILATQAGLPVVATPYQVVGEQLGIAGAEVIARLARMLERGIVRRIGVVPNHYALGYRANGMTVWDVEDEHVDRLGERIGALPYVTHCYRRPRHLPSWRYNLFAMVHGKDHSETERQATAIAALLGDACRGGEVLYSTRILKKTGVRLRDTPDREATRCSV